MCEYTVLAWKKTALTSTLYCSLYFFLWPLVMLFLATSNTKQYQQSSLNFMYCIYSVTRSPDIDTKSLHHPNNNPFCFTFWSTKNTRKTQILHLYFIFVPFVVCSNYNLHLDFWTVLVTVIFARLTDYFTPCLQTWSMLDYDFNLTFSSTTSSHSLH